MAVIVFVFLAGLGAIGAISVVAAFTALANDPTLPEPESLTTYQLPEESIIYDRTGEVELARFGDSRREVVTFDEIPPILLDATTAIEDKTFWENAGFDPVGHHRRRPSTRCAATAVAPRRSPSSSSATGCSTRSSCRTRTGRSSASSRRSSSRSG